MSFIHCRNCDAFINADDDPGCFGEDADLPPFCDRCREEIMRSHERRWCCEQCGEFLDDEMVQVMGLVNGHVVTRIDSRGEPYPEQCGPVSMYPDLKDVQIEELQERITTLTAERDEAREYGERLYAEYTDRKVHCVYCGHVFEDGTPPSQDARLTEHIKVCDKHPMRRYEAKLQDAAHLIIELVHASASPEEWKAACSKAGAFIRTFPGKIK